jgi:ABC-type transporter Mla maintaining outer membrane lipid asymmetry permease subunit MlaE
MPIGDFDRKTREERLHLLRSQRVARPAHNATRTHGEHLVNIGFLAILIIAVLALFVGSLLRWIGL